jgi:heterodisulfide reductase subunit C2
MLQPGWPDLDQEVLRSEGIWLCMACETCVTRCPQEVDLPKVVDFLRTEAVRLGVAHPRSRDILAFHHAFLDSIRVTGRLFEVGLVADYKVRSFHFLKDVLLAPKLYVRGKLGLLPHVIKDRSAMKRIFSRTVGYKAPGGVKA